MPDRTDHACPQPGQGDGAGADHALLVPCPAWCRDKYPHDFELEDSTGAYVRHHEVWAGEHASIDVEERHDLDGSVTFGSPQVWNEAFLRGSTTSIHEVREMAKGLWIAADKAEGLVSHQQAPEESEVVRAIRRDPCLSPRAKVLLIDTYELLRRGSQDQGKGRPRA